MSIISFAEKPAATSAATIDPADVPDTPLMSMARASSAFNAPTWTIPFAPPPEKATNARCSSFPLFGEAGSAASGCAFVSAVSSVVEKPIAASPDKAG
ncbi:hypothetical protein FHS49_003888 [Sphingobium boeckii]|uniref:Uncharacterized protein n=1 Tax=Sphingobium boeckii TaxID=1082345 RepID=A0A7W9ALS1_9SPHN|nr:hypothetical protein [Sphingobium boeckii]